MQDILRCYDGTGDVVAWLEKIKLVAELRKTKDLSLVIPLFLEGQAFSIYQHMSDDDKKSFEKIENVLKDAFSLNPIAAYDALRRREWEEGESVDGYLTDLRRLTQLARIEDEQLLKCAFISGMPADISSQLRSSAQILKSDLPDVLQQARILTANRISVNGCAAYKAGFHNNHQQTRKESRAAVHHRKIECRKCRGNHFIRECPEIECYRCHGRGHMADRCLNGKGKTFAPPVFPVQE